MTVAPVHANTSQREDTPEVRSSPLLEDVQISQLRRENEALSARIKAVEAQAALIEPCMPGQEQPQSAYFGPGRWVRATEKEFFDEVVISGSGDEMKIRVVGAGGIVWPDLPVQPVGGFTPTKESQERTYKRGLALWDEAVDEIEQLLITFERDGLRIDWLRVPKAGSERRCSLFVSKLKRVAE